jgi:NADPH:quinone reductase-like Zn-dependent oxidoreductase
MQSLAARGRIVTCGATTGPTVTLDLRQLFSRDLSIFGARMGTIAEFEEVLKLVKHRKLKAPVSRVFPLAEAGKAHEFLEAQKQFGKVVLKV